MTETKTHKAGGHSQVTENLKFYYVARSLGKWHREAGWHHTRGRRFWDKGWTARQEPLDGRKVYWQGSRVTMDKTPQSWQGGSGGCLGKEVTESNHHIQTKTAEGDVVRAENTDADLETWSVKCLRVSKTPSRKAPGSGSRGKIQTQGHTPESCHHTDSNEIMKMDETRKNRTLGKRGARQADWRRRRHRKTDCCSRASSRQRGTEGRRPLPWTEVQQL